MVLDISAVLDVAIGLIFIFFLFSLIVSMIKEWAAGIFGLRAKHLLNILQNMLNPSIEKLDGVRRVEEAWGHIAGENPVAAKLNANVIKIFSEHPIFQSLSEGNKPVRKKLLAIPIGVNGPSYLASRDFATILMDLLMTAGTAESPADKGLEAIRAGVDKLEDDVLKNALSALLKTAEARVTTAEATVAELRDSIEDWFDATMDRASGWFKRQMMWIGIFIALLMSIAFNVDAVAITHALWEDATLREGLVAQSVAYIQSGKYEEGDVQAQEVRQQLEDLQDRGIPLFWTEKSAEPQLTWLKMPPGERVGFWQVWGLKALGLLITGLAVSSGSHFWYDVLNKLVNMRLAGNKPEPAAAEKPGGER
jgi:hypothetical protein